MPRTERSETHVRKCIIPINVSADIGMDGTYCTITPFVPSVSQNNTCYYAARCSHQEITSNFPSTNYGGGIGISGPCFPFRQRGPVICYSEWDQMRKGIGSTVAFRAPSKLCLRREEAMICAIYCSRSARALFCIKRIVITNVERSKASLKSRSTLLRRSFYDAKKCKWNVLSQSTMSNAKVERVRFRRGRQVNVVKSNKKEVIVLVFYSVNKKNKRTTSRIPTWSPTVVLTGPGNAWLRWADGKRYSHCCMVVPDRYDHLQYTYSSYIYTGIHISIFPWYIRVHILDTHAMLYHITHLYDLHTSPSAYQEEVSFAIVQ